MIRPTVAEHRRRVKRVSAAGVSVQQDAEREHVGACVDRSSVDLLRRHVGRRAHDGAWNGCERPRRAIRLFDARQAEIEDLQPPGGGAHDVFRLEIPVDDAGGMRRRERFCEFQCRARDIGGGRSCARLDLVAQRAAVDELRGDVERAVDFLERVHGADTWMRQPRGRARFPSQPLALPWIAEQMGSQDFQRHLAAQPRVRREIDATHAATSELANDRVTADRGSRRQRLLVDEELRRELIDSQLQKLAARSSGA